MSFLEIAGVHAFHGNVEALKGVDLRIEEGEIVALIGANGAGKSTLLMTICGRPRAAAGRILFAGAEITALPTHEITRLGISQAPEGRRIFPRMTVMENLQIGAAVAPAEHFADDLERVFTLFPVLRQRRSIDMEEVQRHFSTLGVARQKTPEHLRVVPEFQRTAAGKVIKGELRKIARASRQ